MAGGNSSFSSSIAVLLLLGTGGWHRLSAQTAPPLGTARNFAVLGASTVTNTGPTSLAGDLGVSPGTAISGFPPGLVTGTIHAADAVAAQAQLDAHAAYDSLGTETCTNNLTGTNLGGLTLLPGVYCFNSSAQLTGILTLNTAGDPNSVFVFQIGSTLTTASNSAVVVNGGLPCNVYFRVGSSATLGTGTQFSGNIFALASITITTGATATGGSYALSGAVTLDSDAVTACHGTIQVCKVAGSGVAEGASFAFNVAGTPVAVPAGPAPLGSCSLALNVPAQPATITETLPSGTTLASVNTLPSAGLLISSNLGAGTVTVTVDPGGHTVATFVDTIPPVIPTTGFLQICKIAGSGVAPGTSFAFNAAGTAITVAAGLAPGGTCSAPLQLPAGHALISETLPPGTVLGEVSTLPNAGLLVAENLAAGTATVTINAGQQTIASFSNAVNPTTGSIQICKVAGSGISGGTNFSFVVAGVPVLVPAGPAPGGSCGPAQVVPAGAAIVTEAVPPGIILTAVRTSPVGLLVSSNLAAGTATVTVSAAGRTIVTFVNTIIPVPPTGFLQICKIAGAGLAPGTNVAFNVAGTPVTVPAGPPPGGSCSPVLVEPAGPMIVSETLPTGTVLTAVTTLPGGLVVSSNLPAGTATVMIDNGGQTIVTFIDTVPPAIPTAGFIQICSVAGAGVAIGTHLTFSVAGTQITVPAGPAPGGSCSPAMTVTAGPEIVSEMLPSGTTLGSVATLPGGLLVSSNLAAGTATVTVNAAGQTIATFIDTIIPVIPATGFLQICKVAGAGVAIGTGFTYNVAGTTVTVPAGPAPGGSCGPALVAPAGAAVITESPFPGTVLTSVSTLPDGILISSNPAGGAATVTVNAGGQTIATFLNTAVPVVLGQLRVCKVAGAGVPQGGIFKFVVAGSNLTVPAGSCVTGSATFPAGTAVTVSEVPSSGTIVSAISVVPASNQGTVNLSAGTVTATIGAGVTEVDFTNTAGGSGLLKVCKTTGAGILPFTIFHFVMADTSFEVQAGFCVARGLFPVGTVFTITEMPSSRTVTSAISVLPADRQGAVDLTSGTVTAPIGVGVTEVYFTNALR